MDAEQADLSKLWTLIMMIHQRFWQFAQPKSDTKRLSALSVSQLKLVILLAQHSPDAMKLKDIAKALHITSGAVSQTVDALFKLGYIERNTDIEDRRAVAIRLAASGRHSVTLARERVRNALVDALKNIPQQSFDDGIKFLDSLSQTIGAPE